MTLAEKKALRDQILERLKQVAPKDLFHKGRDIQDELDPDELFVKCDDLCLALDDPPWDDTNELVMALAHWRRHGRLLGCSHGR